MKLLLAVAAVLLSSSPAWACKHAHSTPFQGFDEAATVAVGKVGIVPAPHTAGEATLTPLTIIKGARTAAVVIEISDTDCGVHLKEGAEVVVLLDAKGWPIVADDGVLRDPKAWQPVLESWAAAKDSAARAAVLADSIASGNADVSKEAAAFLVDEPALIGALTTDARDKIGKAKASDDWSLPWLLVRLRDASAATKAPKWATLAQEMSKVTAFESEVDPGKLAHAIERGSKASRFAAFERCERVRATKLWRFSRYIEDIGTPDYAAMATSCRAGTAMK